MLVVLGSALQINEKQINRATYQPNIFKLAGVYLKIIQIKAYKKCPVSSADNTPSVVTQVKKLTKSIEKLGYYH